ncbi:MAG: hypothetical protein QNJ12_09350 [Ilumatobacter sp.]|uniref:hypothetical protein n=1 Tax=Ilumatobacter sp. TaxID=1967498 RepID=UPI0026183DCC|nr:hypothetical protein [Ilumatobacter sp.]MDJ0768989.1 hypothetical protein [Ilumatobacter sp.]
MSEPGDIYLAELNDEQRHRVMVASSSRFAQLSGRVLVAPEIVAPPDGVPFPWRIETEDGAFAVDLMLTIPAERLLERTGARTRLRRAAWLAPSI